MIGMKWSLQQLIKYNGKSFSFEGTYDFTDYIKNIDDILRIGLFTVNGVGQNLYDDRYSFQLEIKGSLFLQCARTLQEVEYPLDLQVEEIFDKDVKDDEDVRLIDKNTIDLKDVVWENILLEKPIRVVKDHTDD